MKSTTFASMFLLFFTLLQRSRSQFFTGAAASSCVTLGEDGYDAQPSDTNPYELSVAESFQTGTLEKIYTVSVSSLTQGSFSAIIIQARLQTGDGVPVSIGRFVNFDSTKYRVLNCSGNSADTITNVDFSTKMLPVTFQWEPPEITQDSSIVFVATVVQELGILWQLFQSSPFLIDVTPPTITYCPSGIFILTAPGVSSYPVTWTTPTAFDSSGISETHASNQPGDVFPLGETAVFYQFFDGHGNAATCLFVVTILTDNSPPVISNCPPDTVMFVELGQPGQNVFWTEPTATDMGVVHLVSRNATPSSLFPVGVTTVVYEFTDGVGNSATCTFTIDIKTVDTVPPTISNCPSKTVTFVELGTEETTVDWAEPTASDLGGATLKYRSNGPLSFFPVGETIVVYVFSDSSGNEANCTFLLCVLTEDTTPPTITGCPTNITVVVELGQSGDVVTWMEPTADDLGGTNLKLRNNAPYDFFPVGITSIFYVFCDTSGNTAICTFTVSVCTVDTTPPTISDCPTGSTIIVQLGETGGVAGWQEPSASDLGEVTLESRSYFPSDFFLVGDTSVVYTFVDDSGNKANCTFVVSVRTEDTVSPSINGCPTDVIILVESGQTGYEVTWNEPTASDLGDTTLVYRNYKPSDLFPIGETSVVYTFADSSGNSASCTFIVSVLSDDAIPPRGSCPLDIHISVDVMITGSVVYWTEPTTLDNATALLISQTHESGTFFPVGETTVMYTFWDSFKNMTTCSFIVSIKTDNAALNPPSCPIEHLMTSAASGNTSALVAFPNPTCTDAVQDKVTATCVPASGTRFSVGDTVVACTCRDSAGLQSQCSFIVRVNSPDQTGPVISGCPMNSVSSFPVALSCADTKYGMLELVCNPPAETFFTPGSDTPVTCFCTNNETLSAVCHFNVHPGNTGPMISGCPSSAVNSFPETLFCIDEDDVSLHLDCNPSAEDVFAPGVDTTVICFCRDIQNVSTSCNFNVHPENTPPSSPTCPAERVVKLAPLGSTSAVVKLPNATCTDQEQGVLVATCIPDSSTRFAMGDTNVICTCQDNQGLQSHCSFIVHVNAQDQTGPVISGCPMNSVSSFPVALSCADTKYGMLELVCNPPAETFFTPGSDTPVTCFCTNNETLSAVCHFNVHPAIVEFVPPNCPESVSVITCSEISLVTWSTPQAFLSLEESGLSVSSTAKSGSEFPAGINKVTYIFENATDILGTCSFEISVKKHDNCGVSSKLLLALATVGSVVVIMFFLMVCWKIRPCMGDSQESFSDTGEMCESQV